VLVLEMAIDRPGDMAYLLSFIPVKIGVLTHVSGSHLEYFGTLEAIAREKGLLLTMLPKDGTAIFNADNTYARRVGRRVRAATSIGYGFAAEAQVRAENLQLPRSLDDGLMFRLNYGGTLLPMRLSQVIASHHISAVLAAVAVGVACRINLVDITQALRDFASLPGRMKLLPGLHESALIDDTYNASPASLQAALETLRALPGERRIAVLGDMLELGDETAEAHRRVAQWLQETGVEWAILVGPQMRLAGEALAQRGWSAERYVCLDHPLRAGEVLATWLRPGDRVLLKGSQGMRIELATRAVLAEPERAGELLCRQSEKWLHTAFVERP
jgi:UDP-N-acetylmuramoyl-tripeptide--D-alanyl-D-alanine ligase